MKVETHPATKPHLVPWRCLLGDMSQLTLEVPELPPPATDAAGSGPIAKPALGSGFVLNLGLYNTRPPSPAPKHRVQDAWVAPASC